MFQHQAIDKLILPQILHQTGTLIQTSELEHVTNEAIQQLRSRRMEVAESVSLKRRIEALVDQRLLTDTQEYLDTADFPEERRVDIIRNLHRFNRLVFAYPRFFSMLKPLALQIRQRYNRPTRVLELASGSGEFAMALVELAKKNQLDIEVTGSDYFPGYVTAAQQTAHERGLAMEFRVINAFDMNTLDSRSFDIIFVAQSLHHFSPGQVALMIRQAERVADWGFVGIDGYRSALLWAAVPALGVMLGSRDFLHDAVISLRKFYTLTELELIARLATPMAQIEAKASHPGYAVLHVLRAGGVR